MIYNQAQLFLIFIITGIMIGILFDFFRILRKSFKTNDLVTYFEDFIFWILTGFCILYTIFTFNNGEIRLYMFLAITIGIIVYMIIFSSYVIKINVYIIKLIKQIIEKIISIIKIPFKLIYTILRKLLLKPVSFIIINVKKISTNLYKKPIKISNKIKNKEGIWKFM